MWMLFSVAFAQVLPPQIATWEENPIVVVCRDSEVPTAVVHEALYLLGQDLQVVRSRCDCHFAPNQIKLLPTACAELAERELGRTFFYFEDEVMKSIRIVVRPEQKNAPEDKYLMTVAHELGHAMGYMHSEMQGHLMFPNYEQSGFLTLGME